MDDKGNNIVFRPRSAESDDSSDLTTHTQVWDHAGIKISDFETVTDGYFVDTGECAGYNMVNFHKLKRSGILLPITPWKQVYRVTESSEFDYDLQYIGTSYRILTTNAVVPYGQPYTKSEVEENILPHFSYDGSVQAAAARLYNESFDALTFLAELNETIGMFGGIVNRLIGYIKSGRPDNIWLEGRYGWRSLYYDIVGINEALTKLNEKRTRYRSSVGESYSFKTVQNHTWDFGGPGTCDVVITDTVSVSVRGTVVADVFLPNFAFNPLTTAWELITLSFVVNWVISIGEALAALSLVTLANQHYAGGGHHVVVDRHIGVGNMSWDPAWTGSVGGTFTARTEYTSRKDTSVTYIPQLRVNLNALKILDLLALLYQALRKE